MAWTDYLKKTPVFLVLVVLLALTLRLPGAGSFMTVDEEQWMLRSGTFWHELFQQGDPSGTFVTTHPGATLNWISGAGVFWQEKKLGYNIDTSNLSDFRKAATWPVVVVVSLLIGLVVYLVKELINAEVAIWSGLLLSVEPYLIGMSQISHVDMLLALFMLIGLLGWMLYEESARENWLLLAGAAMGLAMATKLIPSFWLPAFLLGMILIRKKGADLLRKWFFVAGVGALVFYLTWPALWVQNDLGRYYERDVVHIATQDQGVSFDSEEPISPASFYFRTTLGRISPFVLFLSLGVLVAGLRYGVATAVFHHVIGRMQRHDSNKMFPGFISANILMWFSFYVIGFLFGISLAAKKADRYLLPALVIFPLLAAMGWVLVMKIMPCPSKKYGIAPCSVLRPLVTAGLLIALFVQPIAWFPYNISYDSSMFNVRPLPQQGWGEVLDEAAAWLNGHELEESLVIASWYPGVMRTYFNGTTMSLSSRHDDRVGYVVIYRNMMGREPSDVATDVLDEFRDKEPVKIISVMGKPYAWIYEQLGLPYFPKHVGEVVGGVEVGQEVLVSEDEFNHVEIGMATFSSRANNRDVVFHIKESVDADDDLRTVVVNASEIQDSEWHRFEFEPISEAKDKTYFVSITSPGSVAGNAVTVRFSDKDILEGRMLLRRKALGDGEANGDFFREGDLAYRID